MVFSSIKTENLLVCFIYEPWYSFATAILIKKWIDLYVRSVVEVHFDEEGREQDESHYDRL